MPILYRTAVFVASQNWPRAGDVILKERQARVSYHTQSDAKRSRQTWIDISVA